MVGSVVRNAPQPLPVSFADRDGERFCAFDCLHCTSVGRIKQVISAPSTAQELRDCKQKYRSIRIALRMAVDGVGTIIMATPIRS